MPTSRQRLPGTPPRPAAQWSTWIGDRRPDMPKGWATWSAWQFSAEHNGAGPTYGAESADLDLNVVRDDAWRRWTGQDAVVIETLVSQSTVEVAVAKLPEMRAGMTGQQVRIVQALVNAHLGPAGRTLISEDGRWSTASPSSTGKAIAWFQDRARPDRRRPGGPPHVVGAARSAAGGLTASAGAPRRAAPPARATGGGRRQVVRTPARRGRGRPLTTAC